jgi:hypothetical protein
MLRSLQTRLYSSVIPALIFAGPLMGSSVSEAWDYVRGNEFQTFLGEVIIQIFSGFANAFFTAFAALFLGALGGGG